MKTGAKGPPPAPGVAIYRTIGQIKRWHIHRPASGEEPEIAHPIKPKQVGYSTAGRDGFLQYHITRRTKDAYKSRVELQGWNPLEGVGTYREGKRRPTIEIAMAMLIKGENLWQVYLRKNRSSRTKKHHR
jgi:hypothetical protein